MHYSKSHRLLRFPSSSETFMSLLIISTQKKQEAQRFQKGCCLGFFFMWSAYLSSSLFFSVFFIKWSLHSMLTYVLPH